MFRNYLITALRNIARHKLYSVINIAGLAVGLCCVILIALFVRDEYSFDKWVPQSADLYSVELQLTLPGRPVLSFTRSNFPLAAMLKDNLPEVTAMTRFWPGERTVSVSDRAFKQQLVETDQNFFEMIHLPLLAGTPASALDRPDAIVLSQAAAHKLFGDTDPMGRVVAVNAGNCSASATACQNKTVPLRVTGVMRDLPYNTHMRADAVIPLNSPADNISDRARKTYFGVGGFAYVRLAPGSDPAAVERKIPALLDSHVDVMRDLGMALQASKAIQVHLQPFTTVHLNGNNKSGSMVPPANRAMLYGLGLIGFLILLVACFNFVNLATARAMLRAREIAMRKCAGARRGQIAAQFLSEAVLTALLALGVALSAVEIVLPYFAAFLERPLTLRYLADWPFLLLVMLVAAFAGLVSGIYPALMLSRFRPAAVLRANRADNAGSSRLRTALVILQFAVAIGLGIVTVAVFFQIDFVRKVEMGFRRDNIVVINTGGSMAQSARETLVAELRRDPRILDVAASGDVPLSQSSTIAQVRLPGEPQYLTMDRQVITPEFFHLYDMRLLAGRLLSDARGDDQMASANPIAENDGKNILINRTAAARLGFTPDTALGKVILYGAARVRIVGVVNDARIDGAREPARPLVYLNARSFGSYISVRLDKAHVREVLALIDQSWRRLAPGVAIDRHFLDDDFANLYREDEKHGQMLGVFVAIAIVIAGLGMFGLAAFTVSRRTKEIGIRKVFGAHTRDVTILLLWQFSIPVLLANLIAWPIAWYYLHGWLQGFASRISLNPLYFAGVGLSALAIAWATIFTHAWRVARANPIHALRTE
jgi:putative ABC transport system permease protein